MAIPEAISKNFQELVRAIKNNDVCLMQCTHKDTGEPMFAICCVEVYEAGCCNVQPVAAMFVDNPYDFLIPPSPIGEDDERQA